MTASEIISAPRSVAEQRLLYFGTGRWRHDFLTGERPLVADSVTSTGCLEVAIRDLTGFARRWNRAEARQGRGWRKVDQDRAGAEQAPITSLPWLPLYSSAFPDRVTKSAKAVKARPWYQFLGGNVPLLDKRLK